MVLATLDSRLFCSFPTLRTNPDEGAQSGVPWKRGGSYGLASFLNFLKDLAPTRSDKSEESLESQAFKKEFFLINNLAFPSSLQILHPA